MSCNEVTKIDLSTDEVEIWLTRAQVVIHEHMAKNYPGMSVAMLSMELGSKFIRVVRTDSQRSVFAFIARCDSTTKALGNVKAGDVLKSASWKVPAKHARGNIFDDLNGMGSMGPYGPAYLNR